MGCRENSSRPAWGCRGRPVCKIPPFVSDCLECQVWPGTLRPLGLLKAHYRLGWWGAGRGDIPGPEGDEQGLACPWSLSPVLVGLSLTGSPRRATRGATEARAAWGVSQVQLPFPALWEEPAEVAQSSHQGLSACPPQGQRHSPPVRAGRGQELPFGFRQNVDAQPHCLAMSVAPRMLGCCETACKAQDSLRNRFLGLTMSPVLRPRNPTPCPRPSTSSLRLSHCLPGMPCSAKSAC